MNYFLTSTPGAPPPSDVPVFTRLLPAMLSGLALAPAALAYEFAGRMGGLTVALLWVQTWLLALGAMSLAAAAHERLRPWEGRVAPAAARERVRARLLHDLTRMGAIGLSGPTVLTAVLDWQAGELRLLPGAAALLSAGLCGGLMLGLAWQGRAWRALTLPALALLIALTQHSFVRAIGQGAPQQSLAIVAGAVLLWGWLLSPRALVACAPPLPRLQPLAWWRRRWAHRLWHAVPLRDGPHEYRPSNSSTLFIWVFLPWQVQRPEFVEWMSWGAAYDSYDMLTVYGLRLAAVGIFFALCLIAPPVHWRQRLAPGGLTARRWACSLVIGSMSVYAALLSGWLLFVAQRNALPFWPVTASAWLSVMGDTLMLVSVVAWTRARHTHQRSLLIVLALCVAVPLMLALLTWLGLTPTRGPVWLLIQLTLTVPLARAAIRAWAQQDLNAMA